MFGPCNSAFWFGHLSCLLFIIILLLLGLLCMKYKHLFCRLQLGRCWMRVNPEAELEMETLIDHNRRIFSIGGDNNDSGWMEVSLSPP